MHIAAGSLLLEIRFFYIMVVSFNFDSSAPGLL